MKPVIIDYGLCNLRSVFNALKHLGIDSTVSHHPEDLKSADMAILPGVGAFEDGMIGLRRHGLVEAIGDYVQMGKPLLGICLGMQLLMDKSYEFGEHEGLKLISGEVVRFDQKDHDHDIKIPHIGWNGLLQAGQEWDRTILKGLNERDEMYFVHSYYVSPRDRSRVLAETEYGQRRFCSIISKGLVYGCQFHPEKSSQFPALRENRLADQPDSDCTFP